MRQHRSFVHLFLWSVIISIWGMVSSCNEQNIPDPNNSNSSLHGTIDTFTVTGHTVFDTGYVVNALLQSPLGVLNDNVFGKTYANIYTNFELPFADVNLTNPIFDSIVLCLAYNGTIGLNTQPINIQINKLANKLEQKTYFNQANLVSNATVIGNLNNFIPNRTDSVIVNGIKEAPQMRIRLSDALGLDILSQNGQSALSTSTNFQNFFNGLYIQALNNTTGNGMSYFAMFHPRTRLALYYHSNNGFANVLEFPISINANFVNQYIHDRSGASMTINTNNPQGDDLLYLQGCEGTRVKLNLGNPASFKNLIIAKAELILTVDQNIQGLPSKLFLDYEDSVGNRLNLYDYAYNQNIFNGNVSSNLIDGKLVYMYKFDLTKHLHGLKDGNIKKSDIYLYAGDLVVSNYSSKYKAERIVLGGNKPQSKIRLKITYLK
ncbi:MAG: DUF4270 family protein [Bacteroidetes bacterium]|nr:DUF4270 family protein [Bacteroidota bacterium]